LFDQAHKVLKKNGRIVVVTPYIITRSGQSVTMPIAGKLENEGFKLVQPFSEDMFSRKARQHEELLSMHSLVEVDERHKIGRQIHIYQK
jgi:tRNA G10  N-methylase Trm11